MQHHADREIWPIMRGVITGSAAIIFFLVTTLILGAGRSDIADAAMKGDKTAIRTLIQQKADVNAPQVDGATALHWAVYRDDPEAADLLIKAGAKIDAASREGITPLHMASLYGSLPIMERLLKAGADAKQKGPVGETMLMLASRNGNP